MIKKSKARQLGVQFLYQCEMEKIYFFSQNHFDQFCKHQKIEGSLYKKLLENCQGVFANVNALDEVLQSSSEKWSMERMNSIDKCILRLACYELQEKFEPEKVIINEAVELAKSYGTGQSGRFVNGVLDAISKKI